MGKRLVAKKDKSKAPLGHKPTFKSLKTNLHSNASTNPGRKIVGRNPHSVRSKATIKRLNMYAEKPDL